MGIIYCYTNIINNKKYIGQTINPQQRFNQHKSSAFNEKDIEYDKPLHRAFRKYGFDNFEYKILVSTDDIDILNDLEDYFINKYNTKIPNGYNILDGGSNASKPKSEETKIKLMQSHASLSEEEVIALRIAYKDKKSPSEIYRNLYEDKMHYQSFLNIWTGKRYSTIMPEVFVDKGRHTKLNVETVKLIKQDLKSKQYTYAQIADKYKISRSTIADISKERTWKQVTID